MNAKLQSRRAAVSAREHQIKVLTYSGTLLTDLPILKIGFNWVPRFSAAVSWAHFTHKTFPYNTVCVRPLVHAGTNFYQGMKVGHFHQSRKPSKHLSIPIKIRLSNSPKRHLSCNIICNAVNNRFRIEKCNILTQTFKTSRVQKLPIGARAYIAYSGGRTLTRGGVP